MPSGGGCADPAGWTRRPGNGSDSDGRSRLRHPAGGWIVSGNMTHLLWKHLRVIRRRGWVAALPPVLLVAAVAVTLGNVAPPGAPVAGAGPSTTATPDPTAQPTPALATPDAPSASATPSPQDSSSPSALGDGSATPGPRATARPAPPRGVVPGNGVGGPSTVAQIAFGNGQDAYLGHTAGSVYVEINDYEYGRVGGIHAADSSTKVLVYAEAQTEGARSCQWDAHPSWGISYCFADANHPEWFLLDRNGQRAQYTDNGYYEMDLGSATYQQAWATNEIALARRDGFDGVDIDDVNLSPGHGTDGTLAKYSDSQYEAAAQSFIAAVSADLRAAGLVVSANVGNANPWDANALAESLQMAANLSVYNHEFWLRWQEGTPLMNGAEWLASIQMEEAIESTGAAFTALTYGSIDDVTAMRYVRASFLLGWNGRAGSALIYRPDPDVVDPYSPEWTTNVGTPVGGRYAVGVGWRRDFSGGTVLVNPSGGDSQTFDLGGSYRMPDGSIVTTVTLGPTAGLVLLGT